MTYFGLIVRNFFTIDCINISRFLTDHSKLKDRSYFLWPMVFGGKIARRETNLLKSL